MKIQMNWGAGILSTGNHDHRTRRKLGRAAAALVSGIGSLAIVLGLTPALASSGDDRPKFGDTSVFATVPAPGHPFGVAVDGDRVLVSTSVGDFFAGMHMNSAGERVLAYDRQGRLVHTTPVATMPDATMGLWGMALDGNPERDHKLYVADMNGRILRFGLNDDRISAPEVFATPPPEFSGGWRVTMWNDITFDPAGNLLMTDDKPRLWRITPDGKASVWFTDPRIEGLFGFAGGPLGGRIDPSGKFYYFTITISAAFPNEAVVYRLRIVDHPTAADLEVVHRFPVTGPIPPQAAGLAFARSGNLYVGLIGTNEIAVLNPAGEEIHRISSPLFESPWGFAFVGDSLLVTNADVQPVEHPDAWKVLKVYVGEAGLALNRPRGRGDESALFVP
jgi:sugar lactone lactonase YvrE